MSNPAIAGSPLAPGDPAPWFVAPSTSNPRYHFDAAAGRYLALCFFGSAATDEARRLLDTLCARRDLFDDLHASFFGVSADPDDLRLSRVRQLLPGYRYFSDFNGELAALYGVAASSSSGPIALTTFVLDRALRVIACVTDRDPSVHADSVIGLIAACPRISDTRQAADNAPVLQVPRVFEPEFCRDLVALYERNGGEDSGYMVTDPATGHTVLKVDYSHKRRRDYSIADASVRAAIREHVKRRLVPAIQRAFQFRVTRMERYIIACYDAADGGHFRPHRDNTTKGTAHRRFAVTINLNAEDYDGGDLRFPEYDARTYRAPTGCAIVFSCSLLHEATPVTSGKRYCVLPFLYDDAAAMLRRDNLAHIADPKLRENVELSIGS
jgi:peroxiredoxin/predicted 2-oxoglutarate/Fe(II)-dependent dioxygenase YbiX